MTIDINKEIVTAQAAKKLWTNMDFGGFIKPKSTQKAVTNTFTTKINISITNTGHTPLEFYFIRKSKKKQEGNIILLPGEVEVIKTKDILHITWDYIIAKNLHQKKEGAYFIFLCEEYLA